MGYFLYSVDTENYDTPLPSLPQGYSYEIWRPTLSDFKPDGTPYYFYIWWCFHTFGIFRNGDFSVFLIKQDGKLVHSSIISPGYFKFPFMLEDDLSIGDIWTKPEHRGKGLAPFMLVKAVYEYRKPGRKIWTIHDENNLASLKIHKKANYPIAGRVEKIKRFHVGFLGSYIRIND